MPYKIFSDPGLLKIRHSHRFVAVVIPILIPFVLNLTSVPAGKRMAAQCWGREALFSSPGFRPAIFFSCGFLSRHARRAKKEGRLVVCR